VPNRSRNSACLWDWQPLTQTFRQLQQIRTYYAFLNVDVDRYRLGNDYRQVLLSPRELAPDLPGTGGTWVNRRLQYTHGFGIVMAPAADKTPDGRPVLIVQDLPPRSPPSLPISEPSIYHGEETSGYRIVATSIPSSTTLAATRTSTSTTRATAGCRSAACFGASSTPGTSST
jgi:uncharacterized membrane protein (UPF0182 family)